MKNISSRSQAKLGQCAFELFAENGFNNVNLEQIAARAGVTKGSLYWHYKSKKELILAACNYYYCRWQQCVNAEIAAVVDPFKRLELALFFSVKSCVIDRKNRVFTIGIFMLLQEDGEIRASWLQFYNTVREYYIGLVMAAEAAGRMNTGGPRVAVDLMLEAMEGVKLRASFEPHIGEPAEQQEIIDGLMHILCNAGKDIAIPVGMVGRNRYLKNTVGA